LPGTGCRGQVGSERVVPDMPRVEGRPVCAALSEILALDKIAILEHIYHVRKYPDI